MEGVYGATWIWSQVKKCKWYSLIRMCSWLWVIDHTAISPYSRVSIAYFWIMQSVQTVLLWWHFLLISFSLGNVLCDTSLNLFGPTPAGLQFCSLPQKNVVFVWHLSVVIGFLIITSNSIPCMCIVSLGDSWNVKAIFHTYIHTYIQFIEAPFPGLFSHNILTKTNKYTERMELNY